MNESIPTSRHFFKEIISWPTNTSRRITSFGKDLQSGANNITKSDRR